MKDLDFILNIKLKKFSALLVFSSLFSQLTVEAAGLLYPGTVTVSQSLSQNTDKL